ncbi:27254_t:CDS:2, partial [Dentiscutata erythropus]
MDNFTIQVIDGIEMIYEEDLECLKRLESFESVGTVDSLTSDEESDAEYDSA